ncbi:transcription factor IIIB 50 kDa subunit isoform X4 [Pseudorasbora parva]|uniref:transcription factor IIIB 50 kDa subunit isoform X4 n=1 Tax=Pseudorasbora parva TaxID=51549 RepID=UPI00351F34A6
MPSNCPECGSSRVVEDDLYSQRQWVCEDCGSVVSEGHLTTSLSDETQGTNVPYHASTEEIKKPCRNLILGFIRVRALCRILRLSSDMESEVPFCSFKLGPNQVEEVLSETPQRLVDRMSALMELASDTWIVTGRQPLPLLMGSVYMAWQSLNPTARMKYSFTKFCKIGKAPEQSWRKSRDTALKRVSELLEVLCRLGRELPWLRGVAVEPNTVVTLVDDILKHRRALLLRAVNKYEQQLQNELSESQTTECEKDPSESNRSKSPSPETPAVMSSDQAECENPADEEATDCPLPPNHWGKRHLFLPPCVKSRKRQRVDVPQLEVTGDEDISDSEIESYIRSPDEIKLYLKAQKELKQM